MTVVIFFFSSKQYRVAVGCLRTEREVSLLSVHFPGCSLIVALKEPVNKVLEASLKKRA